MNQTKKRLSIIELAISITDIEAIKLQILRLQPLRGDKDIHEILSLLEEENYVRAQKLIEIYVNSETQAVIQRIPEKEQEVIETYDNLKSKSDNVLKNENKNSFDRLLNINPEDVMPSNVTLSSPEESKEEDKKEKIDFNLHNIPKDSFFDKVTPVSSKYEDEKIEDNTTELKPIVEENIAKMVQGISASTSKDKNITFQPIANIEEKIKNIQLQYPAHNKADYPTDELKEWIAYLSSNTYTEKDIEEKIQYIEKLSHNDKTAAAEFLLVTATTESPYAQFILARALYKGSLLQQNFDESFTIMSKLALKDRFPEALCDLAQFYENGIAIDKDKGQAKALYKEAMELGVKRAGKHYERLYKESKGFFSLFKR